MSGSDRAEGRAARASLEEHARRVAEARSEVVTTLGDIRTGVEDALDWRSLARRRPLLAVSSAAVAGFLLARALRRRSGPAPAPAAAVLAEPRPRVASAALGLVGSLLLQKVAPILIERWLEARSERRPEEP